MAQMMTNCCVCNLTYFNILLLLLLTLQFCNFGCSSLTFRYRARVAYDGSGFFGFQIQQRNNLKQQKKQQLLQQPQKALQPSQPNRDIYGSNSINSAKDGVDTNNVKVVRSKKQPKEQRTVQGCLEDVLRQRFNDDSLRVVGAGRTDAGVHSRGQAIHINTKRNILNQDCNDDNGNDALLQQVEHSIQIMLPNDVTLWNLQVAPSPLYKLINGQRRLVDWNVLYDSTRKWYSYRICIGSVMDPLDRHHRWQPPHIKSSSSVSNSQVLLTKLNQILQCYVGTHNFAAFASAVGQNERKSNREEQQQPPDNTIRTVYKVSVAVEDDSRGYYRIDFLLQGALYKQVRNMVGTAVDICCRDKGTIEGLKYLLDSSRFDCKRCDNRSKPAPPEGLTLEYVYFDNDIGF